MVPDSVLRNSVSWLLGVLAGDVAAEEATAGFAPRLTEGRDLVGALAKRFAAFGGQPADVVSFERVGPAKARAVVVCQGREWEFTVAVEAAQPHRIAAFQPRAVPSDAVPWPDIVDRLRGLDHRTSELPEAVAARVHERLLEAVQADRVAGLCCGVIVDAQVVHREYVGTADVRTFEALDDAAVFRVGSVTKLVTAYAVLDLVEEGMLELTAPLTAFAPGGVEATVEDLLLHRAGLPKDLLGRRGAVALPGTLAEAVTLVKPAWPVGERTEYSSLGYELLGLLVEQVTGEEFAGWCARRVLGRFGMAGARLGGVGAEAGAGAGAGVGAGRDVDRHAPSSVIGTEVVIGKVAPVTEPADPYRAAGGMTADLPSVLALAQSLSRTGDPIVRRLRAHSVDAGPGVRFVPGGAIVEREPGPVFWRGGSTRGFTAEIVAAGDGSAAVVLLGAATPAPGLRAAAEDLVRMVVGAG